MWYCLCTYEDGYLRANHKVNLDFKKLGMFGSLYYKRDPY